MLLSSAFNSLRCWLIVSNLAPGLHRIFTFDILPGLRRFVIESPAMYTDTSLDVWLFRLFTGTGLFTVVVFIWPFVDSFCTSTAGKRCSTDSSFFHTCILVSTYVCESTLPLLPGSVYYELGMTSLFWQVYLCCNQKIIYTYNHRWTQV